MRRTCEVITDCAIVCFYDLFALPKDFEARWFADVQNYFDIASSEGILWLGQSDADGRYVIEFYVEETPDLPALRDAVPMRWMPRLKAPSGIICVAPPEGILGLDEMDELPTRDHLPAERFDAGCVFCIEPGDYDVI